MKKKICLFLMVFTIAFAVKAEDYYGSCGLFVEWHIDTNTQTLTIYGYGEMSDFMPEFNEWVQYRQYIHKIVIENGVTSIGEYAFFYQDRVVEITIANSVTSIKNGAFLYCTSLESLSLPNSVTHIDACIFAGCDSLSTLCVESGNPIYDSRENCNAIIETATNTLSFGCKDTTIPNSVVSIGESAFDGVPLKSINVPNSVLYIGASAFNDCKELKHIELPNSVKTIDGDAFMGSGLVSATIGDSVTTIGGSAFRMCFSLKSIEIGSSVDCIGSKCFEYSDSLETIFCNPIIPPTNCDSWSCMFDDCVKEHATLVVPIGSVKEYQNAPEWKDFINIQGTDWLEESSSTLEVFPNPASTFVKIKAENMKEIDIFSVDGREIKKELISVNETEVDISDFNSGVYIIRITLVDGRIIEKKIVVQLNH